MGGSGIIEPKAIVQKLEKFKYPALILLLGLVLILWPSKQKPESTEPPVLPPQEQGLERAEDVGVPELAAALRAHEDGADAGEVARADVGVDLVADEHGICRKL